MPMSTQHIYTFTNKQKTCKFNKTQDKQAKKMNYPCFFFVKNIEKHIDSEKLT